MSTSVSAPAATARQTGSMLTALDPVLEREQPDWVLVYGDTNSTIAGALSAVKMHLPVAHLEAGLRSFNRRMPEEHNRVLTDHCADVLLAPTEEAMRHLADEGLKDRAVLAGDVMVDICLRIRDAVLAGEHAAPALPEGIDPAKPFLLATLHRPDNTDDPERLRRDHRRPGRSCRCRWRCSPTRAWSRGPRSTASSSTQGSVHVGRPLPYAGLVAAVLASTGVVTDSGGLQKEAFLLERITTTIRPETEWVETVDTGWNVLVPDPHELSADEWAATVTRAVPTADPGTPYGDGRAAQNVVRIMEEWKGGSRRV